MLFSAGQNQFQQAICSFCHRFLNGFPPGSVSRLFTRDLIGTSSAQSVPASAVASRRLLPGSGHLTPSTSSGHVRHALASSVSSALMAATADSSTAQAHSICAHKGSSWYTTEMMDIYRVVTSCHLHNFVGARVSLLPISILHNGTSWSILILIGRW